MVPLYEAEHAEAAVQAFDTVPYGRKVSLNDNVTACFHDAGHILGSAMLQLVISTGGQTRTVIFSGDVGRWGLTFAFTLSIDERRTGP